MGLGTDLEGFLEEESCGLHLNQQRRGEGEGERIASGFRRESNEVRGRHRAAGGPKGLSKASCYLYVKLPPLAKTAHHSRMAHASSLQPDASTPCSQLFSSVPLPAGTHFLIESTQGLPYVGGVLAAPYRHQLCFPHVGSMWCARH